MSECGDLTAYYWLIGWIAFLGVAFASLVMWLTARDNKAK